MPLLLLLLLLQAPLRSLQLVMLQRTRQLLRPTPLPCQCLPQRLRCPRPLCLPLRLPWPQ